MGPYEKKLVPIISWSWPFWWGAGWLMVETLIISLEIGTRFIYYDNIFDILDKDISCHINLII